MGSRRRHDDGPKSTSPRAPITRPQLVSASLGCQFWKIWTPSAANLSMTTNNEQTPMRCAANSANSGATPGSEAAEEAKTRQQERSPVDCHASGP